MKSSLYIAINLLIKRFPMHGIMILQTGITVLLLLIIVGRLQAVNDTSEIANTFTGQNAYYFMRYKFIDSTFDISGALNTQGIESFSLGEIANLGFTYVQAKEDKYISAYGYNDTIIESCELKLDSGKWFSDSDCANVPAIAIGDEFHIGDIIVVTNCYDNSKYSIEIIGILNRDTYILAFNRSASSGDSTVEHFISKSNVDMILPYASHKLNSIARTTNDDFKQMESSLAVLVIPHESYPVEFVADSLSLYGHTTYIADMLTNYSNQLRFEKVIYMLLVIVFTILTLVGIGGNNGIQNMLNEHQFVIYFMLGATKRKCVCIEAMRSALLLVSGFILAVLISLHLPAVFYASSQKGNIMKLVVILLYLAMIYVITSGAFLYKLGVKNLFATYKEGV